MLCYFYNLKNEFKIQFSNIWLVFQLVNKRKERVVSLYLINLEIQYIKKEIENVFYFLILLLFFWWSPGWELNLGHGDESSEA